MYESFHNRVKLLPDDGELCYSRLIVGNVFSVEPKLNVSSGTFDRYDKHTHTDKTNAREIGALEYLQVEKKPLQFARDQDGTGPPNYLDKAPKDDVPDFYHRTRSTFNSTTGACMTDRWALLQGLQPGDEILEINRKPVFVHCKDPNLAGAEKKMDNDRADMFSDLEDPGEIAAQLVDPFHAAPFFIAQSTLEKLFLQRPLILKIRRRSKTEFVEDSTTIEYKTSEDKDKKGTLIELDSRKDGLSLDDLI